MDRIPLLDDSGTGIGPHWQMHSAGDGAIEPVANVLRLSKPYASEQRYSNAQIDDYQTLARRNFLWKPPLELTVRARFSHAGFDPSRPAAAQGVPTLRGTAGFGFWNDPFMMTPGTRRPTLPRAIWFFYSAPPSNMPLALDVPGCGWKAATVDAWRWPFFALAPTAPLAVPLMRIGPLYRRLWPVAQRAIGVCEARVEAPMAEWHTYCIRWEEKTAHFFVDGASVLQCSTPPRGPLGLVLWIDNQYMVVTPQGHFRSGLVASDAVEWMEISSINVS